MKSILGEILLKLFVQHPTAGPDFLLLVCLEVHLRFSLINIIFICCNLGPKSL